MTKKNSENNNLVIKSEINTRAVPKKIKIHLCGYTDHILKIWMIS